jgi:hypothetical protein
MLKAYYFLWRRDGMTRDEFVAYYEDIHVDLIVGNLPLARDFRRNFPVWPGSEAEHLGSSPFDVLTAITHESRTRFEEAMKVYRSPPFSDTVTADELRFINRDRVRFVPVDEVIDQLPEGEWQVGPAAPEGAKLLRLIRRPEALDAGAFRTGYETSQVPLLRSHFDGCTDYRRNYIRATDAFSFMSDELKAEPEAQNWDLVEEFCFTDAARAQAAATAMNAASVPEPLAGMTRTSAIVCDQYSRTAAPLALAD